VFYFFPSLSSLLQNPIFAEDLFAGFGEQKGEQAAISGMIRFSSVNGDQSA
jgi:hypothetical protein